MLGLIKESKRAIAKAILCVFSIGLIAASLRANSLPDGFINNVDTALSMSSKSGKNIVRLRRKRLNFLPRLIGSLRALSLRLRKLGRK